MLLTSIAIVLTCTVGADAAIETVIDVGRNPIDIAITPDGNYAYVVNNYSSSVSAINVPDSTVITIAVGAYPIDAEISPDGNFVYAVNSLSDTVSVISTSTNTVIKTISVGDNPKQIAVTPNGNYAYVVNSGSKSVSVINTATHTVMTTIATTYDPRCITVSTDGSYAYVGSSSSSSGVLDTINTASNTVINTLNIFGAPNHVAISTNGEYIYLTSVTADKITIINAHTYTLETTIDAENVMFVVIDPVRDYAYFAVGDSDSIVVLNTITNIIEKVIAVGDHPEYISISPSGNYMCVVNNHSNSINLIDIINNYTLKGMNTGQYHSYAAITPDDAYIYVSNGADKVSKINYTLVPFMQPPYQPGWPVVADFAMRHPFNIGDLDDDGTVEVTSSSGRKIYVWQHTGTYFTNWPLEQSSHAGSILIADLDLDDDFEIVASDAVPRGDSRFSRYHHDGSRMPIWQSIDDFLDSDSTVLDDLNNDGINEVISVSSNYRDKIYAFDQNGQQLNGWPVYSGPSADYNFKNAIAIGDIDNDGANELIACSRSAYRGVYVYKSDGSIAAGWPNTSYELGYSEGRPILGDLDNNGDLEIIFYGSNPGGKINVLNHDGTHVAGWPVELGISRNQSPFPISPVMGDIDRDGIPEIVVGINKFVYALNKNGDPLFGWPVETDEIINSQAAIADIDSDGYPEILVCGIKKIFAWHFDGSPVEGWPITTLDPQVGYLKNPALCDLDNDGDIELLAYSNNNLYAWDLSGEYDPDYVDWSMFQADTKCTGVYRPKLELKFIDDKEVNEGEFLSFVLEINYEGSKELTVTAMGLPTGASFDPASLIFSWTTGYDQSGIYENIRFQVNAGMLISYKDVKITVHNTNLLPTATIDSISPNPANEGEAVTLAGHGEDEDGDIADYNWRSDINGGLGNSSTLIISTLSLGIHTIFFKVKDNDGAWSDEVTQELVIQQAEQGVIYGRVFEVKRPWWVFWRRPRLKSLAGAIIRIKSRRTGIAKSTVSDEGGRYRIENLPQNLYRLKVTKEGYRTRRRIVFLKENRQRKVNIFTRKK